MSTAPTIRLADYTEPNYWAKTVHLQIKLHPEATRVLATIGFEANESVPSGQHDLLLDGASLKLISAAINGVSVLDKLILEEEGLRLPAEHIPSGAFEWVAETETNPKANTSLEGLYMSNGMYCTQCEAEGFRKITYYQDRPDVMATFTVRIEGDLPIMLSNGNLVEQGEGFVQWHDPFPKPAYLFALVAGDLVHVDDNFTTASGREVELKIYVRPGDEDKCDYAMDSLKRSMKWDEEVYGREYDLDLFMIVAVYDFNMGAMENKGLNIFNSKYVLASPDTATDTDYALIEGIIAHEYLHNWTGNRITCRDWFQLCLKEGLTVFRDQQFSASQRSEAVQRISDVKRLRGRQFPEDAGPLAHPVRPEEYIEINNFYTATVYEKGAELIRMLRLLVGPTEYRRATDLYFEKHDGQACTIEDWIAVFSESTGQDLSHFAQWYSQAGTPEVSVSEQYEPGHYTLTLSQKTKPTPGQPKKNPQVIPVSYGFMDEAGNALGEPGLLVLTEQTQSFSFELASKPIASLFRDFSAPITLSHALSSASRAQLVASDSDPFNRWEAGHTLARESLTAMVTRDGRPDPIFLEALAKLASDESIDPDFKAMALGLPSEGEVALALAGQGHTPDPDLIYSKREELTFALASKLKDKLAGIYAQNTKTGPFTPDAKSAGHRALRNRALSLLAALDPKADEAQAQFGSADNMSDSLAALSILVQAEQAENALATFYERWKSSPNVLDKWFGLQAVYTPPKKVLSVVQALSEHPDFNWKTPNRYSSLVNSFAIGSPAGFHQKDGKGYEFVASWILRLDAVNPQTAARTIGAFETWKMFDEGRQALMKVQLERIRDTSTLSKDVSEKVSRILGAS